MESRESAWPPCSPWCPCCLDRTRSRRSQLHQLRRLRLPRRQRLAQRLPRRNAAPNAGCHADSTHAQIERQCRFARRRDLGRLGLGSVDLRLRGAERHARLHAKLRYCVEQHHPAAAMVRGSSNSPQAQATARDSRLGLRLEAPDVGRVRASANIETDFNAPPPIEYTRRCELDALKAVHYAVTVGYASPEHARQQQACACVTTT